MTIPYMASPTPNFSGGAAAPAVSGGGAVYHGDVNSGVGVFGLVVTIVVIGALAFKLGKRL